MDKKVKEISVKYITNQANIEELNFLENWIKKPSNRQVFANYIKLNYAVDVNINPIDVESAKNELLKQIRHSNKKTYKIKVLRYTAAASIALFLAAGFWFMNRNVEPIPQFTEPTIVNNQIEPGTDKAVLTLANGEEITLEKGQSVKTANATSNGEELIYNAGERSSTDIAYNTLTVPRGAQHYVLLSDGTKVWLNSESQIRYPVSFIKGQTRQVELLYGEVYFDVTPSTQNQGAGFKVAHKGQEVKVLGTEFNIKAYNDETNIYTTLVEGKVSVTPVLTDNSQQLTASILAPTEQAVLDLTNNNMSITTIDVYAETSWKEGIFNFKGKTLKEVMQVLSRWYDMEVVFKNKDLETIKFRGVIRKSKPIAEVLSIITSTSVDSYEINNKTIILKR